MFIMQEDKNPVNHPVGGPLHAHLGLTPVQMVDPEQWTDQPPMLVQMVVDHQELELEMTEERVLVMLPPPEH